jgi:hypothetical protein
MHTQFHDSKSSILSSDKNDRITTKDDLREQYRPVISNTEHSVDPIARSLHHRHDFAFRPNSGAVMAFSN